MGPRAQATTARPPGKPKWPWIGGAAIVVAVILGGAILVGTGKSSDTAAPLPGPAFSAPTDECQLVSKTVLDRYVPGAACRASAYRSSTFSPSWTVTTGDAEVSSIEVALTLSPDPRVTYAQAKKSVVDGFVALQRSPAEADLPAADLDPNARVHEAHMISGQNKLNPALVDARLFVLVGGNGVLVVRGDGWKDAESARTGMTAIATDIIANLR
ncbi:hypothetical protein Ntsu_24400 [Nocardia sp. IFM 10818]